MKKILALFTLLAASGCGDTNFNGIFFSSGSEDTYQYLLADARIKFDQGEFSEAQKSAEKIVNQNPNIEEAVVLLANIYLSLAQLDPFIVARKMIQINEGSVAAGLVQAKSSADTLTTFTDIVDIGDDEFALLGSFDDAGGIFGDAGVLLPNKPGLLSDPASARSQVETLRYINKAITVICPFISNTVIAAAGTDPKIQECANADASSILPAQSNFIWALANLAEAMVFTEVLLYSGTGSASVLETRVEAVESPELNTAVQIQSYLDRLTEIRDNVATIFDSSEDSMLTATVNNLNFVVAAFDAIPGIPDSLTSEIKRVLNEIETKAAVLDGESESEKNAKALQGELNETLAKKLESSFKNPETNEKLQALSQDEKDEACASFEQLAIGTDATPPANICG